MRLIASLVLSFLLAGQAVLALNIAVGANNFTANDLVTRNDSDLTSQCQNDCEPANNAIQACGDVDGCLCNNDTATAITACQQCYFSTLIRENRMMPDSLAGSTPALAAYVAACQVSNVTVPATEVALKLPSDWDGPTGVPLNLGETILYVMTAAVIGVGSIGIICTM